MTPMKMSGSQVSMKFVTSSKNDGLLAFGTTVGDPGTWMSRVDAPSCTRTMSVPECSSAALRARSLVGKVCAHPVVAGATQKVAAPADAGSASTATSMARAIATRRRRSGEGTATAVIHEAHRQAGALALPRLVRRGDGRACSPATPLCHPFEPLIRAVLAPYLGARLALDEHDVGGEVVRPPQERRADAVRVDRHLIALELADPCAGEAA